MCVAVCVCVRVHVFVCVCWQLCSFHDIFVSVAFLFVQAGGSHHAQQSQEQTQSPQAWPN